MLLKISSNVFYKYLDWYVEMSLVYVWYNITKY